MIVPGIAPMYVRRWPRISASSRTPPTEMRDELAPERARDRLAERRLADAGRADEAEDRAGDVVLQLRDGEVLDDPLLHLLEVVVVLVEDAPRLLEVEVVLGRLRSTAASGSSRGTCG